MNERGAGSSIRPPHDDAAAGGTNHTNVADRSGATPPGGLRGIGRWLRASAQRVIGGKIGQVVIPKAFVPQRVPQGSGSRAAEEKKTTSHDSRIRLIGAALRPTHTDPPSASTSSPHSPLSESDNSMGRQDRQGYGTFHRPTKHTRGKLTRSGRASLNLQQMDQKEAMLETGETPDPQQTFLDPAWNNIALALPGLQQPRLSAHELTNEAEGAEGLLICLQGNNILAESMRQNYEIMVNLLHKQKVVCIDEPGVGDSGGRSNSATALFDPIYAQIKRYIVAYKAQHEGLEDHQILLHGHSLGGFLALLLAARLHKDGIKVKVSCWNTFASLADMAKHHFSYCAPCCIDGCLTLGGWDFKDFSDWARYLFREGFLWAGRTLDDKIVPREASIVKAIEPVRQELQSIARNKNPAPLEFDFIPVPRNGAAEHKNAPGGEEMPAPIHNGPAPEALAQELLTPALFEGGHRTLLKSRAAARSINHHLRPPIRPPIRHLKMFCQLNPEDWRRVTKKQDNSPETKQPKRTEPSTSSVPSPVQPAFYLLRSSSNQQGNQATANPTPNHHSLAP